MAPTFSRELIQVLSRTTGAGAPSPQDIEREIARRVLFRDLYDKLSKGCKMLSVKLLCIVPTEEEIANVVEEARTFHDSVLADFNHLNSLPTASHLAADLQRHPARSAAARQNVIGRASAEIRRETGGHSQAVKNGVEAVDRWEGV